MIRRRLERPAIPYHDGPNDARLLPGRLEPDSPACTDCGRDDGQSGEGQVGRIAAQRRRSFGDKLTDRFGQCFEGESDVRVNLPFFSCRNAKTDETPSFCCARRERVGVLAGFWQGFGRRDRQPPRCFVISASSSRNLSGSRTNRSLGSLPCDGPQPDSSQTWPLYPTSPRRW